MAMKRLAALTRVSFTRLNITGKSLSLAAALTLSTALTASPAMAQDYAMGWFNNSAQIMDSYVGQAAMASVAKRGAKRTSSGSSSGTAPRPSPQTQNKTAPRKTTPVAALSFPADAATSKQVRDRFRGQLVRGNPAKTAQIDQALKQDWMRGYATDIARPNGLDPRNLADSHAAYLIASWALVNNVTTLSPRSIAAVRDKVRGDLARDAKVAALSPALRQSLGEELNYNTVLVMANRTQIHNTGDKALQSAAAKHYKAQFAKLGIDLAAIKLTDAGFVSR